MYRNTATHIYIYILNKLNHFGVYLKLIHFKSTNTNLNTCRKKINESSSFTKEKRSEGNMSLLIHKTV